MKQVWVARVNQAAAKYSEHAPVVPACCNVCRTCTTTNLIGLVTGAALAAIAAVGVAVKRLFAEPS